MALKKNYTTFKNYYVTLKQKCDPFPCPLCNNSVLPRNFETHCFELHNFNPRLGCVWCGGKESWARGKKSEHVDHLLICFKNFISKLSNNNHDSKDPEIDNLVLLNTNPMTEANVFFKPYSLVPLDSVRPLEVDPPALQFRDENLNLAVSYVQKYLEICEESDWFHGMVKLSAHDSFVRVMNSEEGCHTLLFSCWCDGGPQEEPTYRLHRHFIVASFPKGRFKTEVWPRVKPSHVPYHNFPSKRLRVIESPAHLANAIGYVSQQKSRCNFSFKNTKNGPKGNHHFYVFKSLPADFKLPLFTQWDGGISRLLYQECFQNISPMRVSESPLVFENGRYMQKIKHFYNLKRGLVLPVQKRFVPTKNTTPYFVHLNDGKKLYFESFLELSDDETWLRKQARGNNLFFDVVGEDMWIPRPDDQRKLGDLMTLRNQIEEQNTENVLLKRRHEEEMDSLKSKCKRLEEEADFYKKKSEKLEEEVRLKQSKIETLQEKIDKLKDEDIARLKEENAKLKEKMERMKRKYEQDILNLSREIAKLVEANNALKQQILK